MPHSTGSRLGTAVKVLRTWPVAYSPVMNSAPSTPVTSIAISTAARLTEVGSNAATAAAPCGGRAARSEVYSTPNPMITPTQISSDQAAEGSDHSLVNSARITRRWVTRWAWR